MALPQPKTENDYMFLARFVFALGKGASQKRPCAQECKKIPFRWRSNHVLRPALITQVVSRRPAIERHVLEAVRLHFPVEEIRAGHGIVAGGRLSFVEPNQLTGIVEGKRSQENRVNHAEDCSI